MTPEERQEIRERHFLWKERECNYDGESYPCYVIKVLNSYDKQDADILEIIHTYDQEPISAVVRIWNLLGNRA